MIIENRFQRINAEEFCERYGLEINKLEHVIPLLDLSPVGPWLVGGAVRRLITGAAQDSDFDIAFMSESQLMELSEGLSNDGLKFKDSRFHREHTGDIDGKPVKIQLLKVFFGTIESVLSEFDFTLCQCAYDGTDLIFGPYTLWDIGRKRISVNKITFAASSVRRLIKYSKQGYFACTGCAVDLLQAVVKDPGVINAKVEYVD